MDNLESFEPRMKSLAKLGAVWLAAPLVPPLLVIVAQAMGASSAQALEVQDWVAAAVLFLLVPLSIWGAVEVEELLSQATLSPLALLYLPFASVCAIGLATQLGRQASV